MDEDVGAGVGPSERAHDAGGAGPTPERRRRMSARRKQDAVLRLLRGEDLELLSRQLGVTAADLSSWRGAFLAAGEASFKTRPTDARDAASSPQADNDVIESAPEPLFHADQQAVVAGRVPRFSRSLMIGVKTAT